MMKNLLTILIVLLFAQSGFGQIIAEDSIKIHLDSTQLFQFEEFKKIAFNSNVGVVEIKNCLNKEIHFIGTHHFGTNLYYQNIKSLIDSFHSKGYVVYYEGIRADTSSEGFMFKKQISMKYKRIMGKSFYVTRSYNEIASNFKDLIAQPQIDSLGKINTDVEADVSVRDIVEYYEGNYGKVHDSIPQQKDYDLIINDIRQSFRNKYLFSLISKSEHDKIVILFGEKHLPPLEELFIKTCN